MNDDHEHRIYGDDRASMWAVVDELDYWYFSRWRWCPRQWKNKIHLRRAVGESSNGQRLRTYSLYLHVEIMKRTGIAPASNLHCLVDHKNGDSLDCRRSNLRWATRTENNRNRFGSYMRQGILT